MSKFGLALIAVTAISVVMATHAYYIQAADAQARIPNNSVRSETIVDGQVKTQDLASGAIQLNVHKVEGPEVEFDHPSTQSISSEAECPSGEILTGGGFTTGADQDLGQAAITASFPVDENTWRAIAFQDVSTVSVPGTIVKAFALCIDPSLP